MMNGTIEVGGHEWDVREERRQGPYERIFVLDARDESDARMQVRPDPGTEISTLEEVRLLAHDPHLRWFRDDAATIWEARIVVSSDPGKPEGRLVKFLSRTEVYEVKYDFADGLGARTDDQLRDLLSLAREAR